MHLLSATLTLYAFGLAAEAHTIVRSIWVDGVDQGSFHGVRRAGYNGPPGPTYWGYNSSPVKNLTSLDLRCNVLGDQQAANTIRVRPGQNISIEWGHESRQDDDDIIAPSHHGPGFVYISPDPPTDSSWIKLWEEGEYEPGKWFATGRLVDSRGVHSVQVPEGLKAGYYLLRPEIIAHHESDARFDVNPIRGAQFYMACIQLEILGDGEVELPSDGVGFPGAYKYDDPGIHYNIYLKNRTSYTIPGPTVWSGAATPIPNPTLGPKKNADYNPLWSDWVESSTYYTLATATGANATRITLSKPYELTWSTTYNTPVKAVPTAPAITAVQGAPRDV